MSGSAAAGRVERKVRRLGHQGSVVLRVTGVAATSVFGLMSVPPTKLVFTAAVVLAVNAWSVLYLVWSFRGERSWPLYADTCVVATLCLAQPWTTASQGSVNWVVAAVSLTVVAHQWQARRLHRTAPTTVLIAACVIGLALAAVPAWACLSAGLPMVVSATLSWSLYRLVTAGAREADRIVGERERARLNAEIATARRADEREYLATLHDGAAATMLAVGTGVVTGREPWLSEQAVQDLEALAQDTVAPHSHVDLGQLLGEVVRQVPVRVDARMAGPVSVPGVPAVAICRAAREALVNVARHAQVDAASLLLQRGEGTVTVEVSDDGRGFHPAHVPAHRHGLSLSIVDRMARVGGRATVRSCPGRGTRIRLEWPDG